MRVHVMNFLSKKYLYSILFSIILLLPWVGFGNVTKPITMKVALLDSFIPQQYMINHYYDYYIAGVATAAYAAKQYNITIEYRFFNFGSNDLAILSVLPEIIKWDPTFIIGPRSSNYFLLLNGNLPANILVLSPMATDLDIAKMPENFYSLTLSDKYEAKAIYTYLNKKFPAQGIFLITEVDCKSCTGVSDLVSELFNKDQHARLLQKKILKNQVENIDIKELMQGYQDGDIILLPDSHYVSSLLMTKIADYLKQDKLIFLGGDAWGTWRDGDIESGDSLYQYSAYHISPWSYNFSTKEFNAFSTLYLKKYPDLPLDNITYATYKSVMSVVVAFNKFGNRDKISSVAVLKAYQTALKYDKNWFRGNEYVVYQDEKSSDKIIASIQNDKVSFIENPVAH